MASLDTNIAENFLFDASIAKNNLDANNYVIKSRNISPIIDQQKGSGSYNTGTVIIDAQSFGNGSDYPSWSEGYITLPYRVTLDCTAGSTSTLTGAYDHNLLTALKNNSLIESIKVEQAGKVIINETQNLSHLVNFIQHCTTTQEALETQSVCNAYYPDGEYSTSAAASLQGVSSNANFYNGTNFSLVFNDGLFKRQKALYPLNDVTGSTIFSSITNQANEFSAFQSVANPVNTISTTGTTLSSIHFLAVLYLKDLSDYFAKHPLSRGLGYKITLKVNQAISTASLTTTTTPFNILPTLSPSIANSGATVQPAMLCTGPATIVGNSSVTATSTTYTYTLTSAIDVSNNTRQSGVILYVPSYMLSEESDAKYLSDPVIYRNPFMINSAMYDNRGGNAPINLQLFSAISNPRALIVIPQLAQATQVQPSQLSPLNPSPGVTDPVLSLTRIQIRVNSRPVLPNNSNYAFQQFIDHTMRIFKINGGESNVTSGVINFTKFSNNYRYYAFDLTQVVDESQRDVPQLITFEGFNNSAVAVDLYVFVLYESTVTFDVLKGAVEIM